VGIISNGRFVENLVPGDSGQIQVLEGIGLKSNLLHSVSHCSTHNAARVPLPPSWAKNIGPKLFHQKRTVLWLISIPRSWSRSSTLRSESGKRMYIITTKRMTSGLVLKHLKGERLVIPAG